MRRSNSHGLALYVSQTTEPYQRPTKPNQIDAPGGGPSMARRLRLDPAPGGPNQTHASNTSSTGTCNPVTIPFVCIAMPITASNSPCIALSMPFAFALAV